MRRIPLPDPRRARRLVLAAALAVAAAAVGQTARGSETPPAHPAASPAPSPAASPAPDPGLPTNDAERSLWASEQAFADSFAARDPEKFASFLDEQAIFLGRRRLHGKAEVREVWAKMMTTGPAPPFSWRPTRAMVAGDVGMTSGPVYDPQGKWVGAFTSVWRRQPDGSWKIVLDGGAPCEDPRQPAAPGG
jgi:ketosteroid isomerase-like protein